LLLAVVLVALETQELTLLALMADLVQVQVV
jgi:hypothetical protein